SNSNSNRSRAHSQHGRWLTHHRLCRQRHRRQCLQIVCLRMGWLRPLLCTQVGSGPPRPHPHGRQAVCVPVGRLRQALYPALCAQGALPHPLGRAPAHMRGLRPQLQRLFVAGPPPPHPHGCAAVRLRALRLLQALHSQNESAQAHADP
ncbi:hypothetical protein H4R20_007274, partial [Coemansia guatemalensis]